MGEPKSICTQERWLRARVLVSIGQEQLHPIWGTPFFNQVLSLFPKLTITLRSYKQLWREILWPVFTCYALLSPNYRYIPFQGQFRAITHKNNNKLPLQACCHGFPFPDSWDQVVLSLEEGIGFYPTENWPESDNMIKTQKGTLVLEKIVSLEEEFLFSCDGLYNK